MTEIKQESKNPDANLIEPEYAAKMFREDDVYRERCMAQCREWGRANKTDPFAYARALNEYATGVAYAGSPTGALFAGAQGYNVMWSQEPRVSFLDGNAIDFYAAVPINMKRP